MEDIKRTFWNKLTFSDNLEVTKKKLKLSTVQSTAAWATAYVGRQVHMPWTSTDVVYYGVVHKLCRLDRGEGGGALCVEIGVYVDIS